MGILSFASSFGGLDLTTRRGRIFLGDAAGYLWLVRFFLLLISTGRLLPARFGRFIQSISTTKVFAPAIPD